MKQFQTITPDIDHFVNNIKIKDWSKSSVNHKHTFFELFYVTEGHIMHSFNNQESIPMTVGDYMLIDIGNCHSFDICDGKIINVGFLSTAITKHLPVCTGFFQLLSYHAFSVVNTSTVPFPINTILHDDDGYVLSLIKIMRQNAKSAEELIAKYVVKHQMISLILYIAQKYCSFDTPTSVNTLVQTVLKIVSYHYKDPNPLNIAAREVSYSPAALSIAFKSAMDMNFKEYLQRYRIDIAKQQLKITDLKISDICSNVGYSDTKFFTKLFKKYVGLTPSEYRKSVHIEAPLFEIENE